jgi:uncharacterized protein YjbI with pentapeptide repeats
MCCRHVCIACALLITLPATGLADIFRWDNGGLIPGTQGIEPGPGVQLTNRQLQYARFSQTNLTGANFASSDLTQGRFYDSTLDDANLSGAILSGANFSAASMVSANLSGAYLLGMTDLLGQTSLDHSNLTNANLSEADLTRVSLSGAKLDGANLTGATIKGAVLSDVSGFIAEQLYSTASYQSNELQNLLFIANNLTGWDFSGQNLTDTWFLRCSLENADLSGANLTGTEFTSATLAGADFEGAIVSGTNLQNTTSFGFTKEQLNSTASYRAKDLQGILLRRNDLSGWDFSGQNLSGADFFESNLSNADLTDAVIAGTSFAGTTSLGFKKEQLYSTASYQAKDLKGIAFYNDDLSGWDFSGQNLTGASLWAELTNADFTDAVVTGAYFAGLMSKEQFYSTRDYQTKDLRRLRLGGESNIWYDFRTDMSGWDFHGQDLSNAYLSYSSMAGTDLRGANLTDAEMVDVDLTGADTRGAVGLSLTDATTTNMIRPDGRIEGLNLIAGEKLIAYAGVPIPVKIGAGFSIAPTATFDLTDNGVIVDYAGASPVATVREQILLGRGGAGLGGQWNGTGITSSTAAGANESQPDSRSLGYADNATLPLGSLTSFHGAAIDDTSILIAYTRTGDANLDGVVNDDDVTILGAFYAPGVPQPHWALGDFDYNGFVDDDDVTLLNAFYDPSAAPLNSPFLNADSSSPAPPGEGGEVPLGVSAIPEPPTAVLACLAIVGVVALLRRGSAAR